MANIKSAKKRAVTNKKHNLSNRIVKTNLKTVEKAFLAAVESGDKEAANLAAREASKKFDMAASKGVIHKNAADRKKAQFAVKLNTMA